MSTKKGPKKEMAITSLTIEENRDATLETFKTLAEQAEKAPADANEVARTIADSGGAVGLEIPAKPDPLNEAIAATAGMASSIEPDINAQEEALKARAAALEGYIKAGVAKCMIAIENHEIVSVAGFRAAIEALMRHLHEDHPENYLP